MNKNIKTIEIYLDISSIRNKFVSHAQLESENNNNNSRVIAVALSIFIQFSNDKITSKVQI